MIRIEIPYRKPESHISMKTGKRYTKPFNGLPISDNRWSAGWMKHWDKKYYKDMWESVLKSWMFQNSKLIKEAKIYTPIRIKFIIYKAGIENDSDRLRTPEITDILLRLFGLVEKKGKIRRVRDTKDILPERAQVETVSVKHFKEQKTIIEIQSI